MTTNQQRLAAVITVITVAGAIAEVAGLFANHTKLALTLLTIAALGGATWWSVPAAQRRYRNLVTRDEQRTRDVRGDPTIEAHGSFTTVRDRTGNESYYVPELPTYKRLLRQGKLDPTRTFNRPPPTVPQLPAGWIGRLRARRAARRQGTT